VRAGYVVHVEQHLRRLVLDAGAIGSIARLSQDRVILRHRIARATGVDIAGSDALAQGQQRDQRTGGLDRAGIGGERLLRLAEGQESVADPLVGVAVDDAGAQREVRVEIVDGALPLAEAEIGVTAQESCLGHPRIVRIVEDEVGQRLGGLVVQPFAQRRLAQAVDRGGAQHGIGVRLDDHRVEEIDGGLVVAILERLIGIADRDLRLQRGGRRRGRGCRRDVGDRRGGRCRDLTLVAGCSRDDDRV